MTDIPHVNHVAPSAIRRIERNLSRPRSRRIIVRRLAVCSVVSLLTAFAELEMAANGQGARSETVAGLLAGIFAGLMFMSVASGAAAVLLAEEDGK